MELPKEISLLMTTWCPSGEQGEIRRNAVEKAVESWKHYLRYDSRPLHLHVADDGSDLDDYGTGLNSPPCSWWNSSVGFSRQIRQGVGASFNAGFKASFLRSPLMFYAVDDWRIFQEFDITPWAKLLMEKEDLGLIIFSPSDSTSGKIEQFYLDELRIDDSKNPHNFLYFLRLQGMPKSKWEGSVAPKFYTQRPALYHKRFYDRWGEMPVNGGSIWSERVYNERWVESCSNDIGIAINQPWRHIPSTVFSLIHPPGKL